MPQSARRAGVPDEALVRFIYEKHGQALLAYATSLTRDRAEAEDAVQETLVRAWRHAADLVDERGSVRGWLWTVVRNVVTDRFRARAIRAREVLHITVEPPAANDHAQRVVDGMVVAESLRRLPPEHRVVIEHVYLCGRTVAETAQLLGIPIGTVKSRKFYGLRMLREIYPAHAYAS